MIDKYINELMAMFDFPKEQAIKELIEQRRHQVMVHSFIYYELGKNIIDDSQWDIWAKELQELQETYPEISKGSNLYDDFKEFDACSGYYLNFNQEWVVRVAHRLLKINSKK